MALNKLTVVAFALALSAVNFLQAETVQAEDTYASIAYSTSTGEIGFAYNAISQREAEDLAVSVMKSPNARPMVWVRNGYLAFAVGDDVGAYGWGWATTAEEAQVQALQEASRYTTNCVIAICLHSKYGKQ